MATKSILVVDDDLAVRELLRQILTKAGYDAVCVSDGNQALTTLDSRTFDLIISDIVMPEKSGLELIPAILKNRPGTKIIAMSGAGIQIVKSMYLTMASAAFSTITFMDKPFEIDALLALITETIDSPPP